MGNCCGTIKTEGKGKVNATGLGKRCMYRWAKEKEEKGRVNATWLGKRPTVEQKKEGKGEVNATGLDGGKFCA